MKITPQFAVGKIQVRQHVAPIELRNLLDGSVRLDSGVKAKAARFSRVARKLGANCERETCLRLDYRLSRVREDNLG